MAIIEFDNLDNAIGLKPGLTTVGSIINTILPTIFAVAGFILLYYLVSGGFAIMFSKGDQRAIEAGKAKVTNAVIGFVILFVAYWIVQILGIVFKIPMFGQIFK